ncbi:hypothetical protein A1359_10840 [Methylomonas lenta]|uniref:Uncharacterized protein n=1 Tax=Methylomonas lenta TaxID=980561 RepID=A0A177N8U1_9GAMM|nr:hypothetical protein A1359_10840 [Methylomonas lenta]
MQGCIAFFVGAGMPLRKTPFKHFGAQDQRGIRVSFLLGTFLWTSKEKYRGCRSANRLQKTVAISDTKKTSATIILKSPETPTGLFWPTDFFKQESPWRILSQSPGYAIA